MLIRSKYVRPKGTVVAIGLPAGAFLKAPVFQTVVRMKTIKGSYVGNRKDTTEALDFFERGFIKAPFKTIGMSELQKVYDLMRKASFPVILIDNLLILFQMRARLPDDTWWIPANRRAASIFHVVNCVVAHELYLIRRCTRSTKLLNINAGLKIIM